MSTGDCDIAVIGGGIVGLATAMELAVQQRFAVTLLEAEDTLAGHQTGHNSGVIHSGLYYKPGSLKARNCVSGREELYRFCRQHDIPHQRCGKIVVATQPSELPILDQLHNNGLANGLSGLQRLEPGQLGEYEPHVRGLGGLYVPDTGIVDFVQVARRYAAVIRQHGGVIRTATRLEHVHRASARVRLRTSRGELSCCLLINCAGLQADRVARLCGANPALKIIPFRGEYFELLPDRRHLVRHLIYPVPDPRLPFLGVHLTRTIDNAVHAGPNAVLAFNRHGYRRCSFSLRDTADALSYGGFWKMARRFLKPGLGELYRSWNFRAYVRTVQELLPEVRRSDLRRSVAGVRAQAVRPDGRLVDDFEIVEDEQAIHVLNVPSPAATASLPIGRQIARTAAAHLCSGEAANTVTH